MSHKSSKLDWGLQGSVPVRLKEQTEGLELQLNVVLQASGESLKAECQSTVLRVDGSY
jgi:hypothetical protein